MDTSHLPDAQFRRLDLFPAQISGRKGFKRAVVTDSYLVVVGESNEGPQIEEIVELYDFSGNNKTGWTAQLESESGETVTIKRASGCGCGSRLRGAKLYQGVPLRSQKN